MSNNRSPRPVLQDRVSACNFTRCKHPDCFPILLVRKVYKCTWTGYFWCFFMSILRNGCYAKQTKSKHFFNPAPITFMGAQVKSSAIANTCWWIQTFKWQCFGFQGHFKPIWVYTRFLMKMVTLHDRSHNKKGSYIFHISIDFEFGIYLGLIVPDLKCIYAVFTMLWPFQ